MSGSPFTDLSRPPLNAAALRRALVQPAGRWTTLQVVAETDSTNTDLVAQAYAGAPDGAVLIAEAQRAGRGRLGRQWLAPVRAALTFSVLLRPSGVPASRFGWLPLLAGVAAVEAVGRVAVVDAALKWPNDLLVRSATSDHVTPGRAAPGGPEPVPAPGASREQHSRGGGHAGGHDRGGGLAGYGKCAGVLAEAVPPTEPGQDPAVVLGLGLNVSQSAEELPAPVDPTASPATSLALAGAVCTDRDPLLRALLRALSAWYGRWLAAGGDPQASGVAAEYRRCCATLGDRVRVLLPDGLGFSGTASDVDDDGRLVVIDDAGPRRVVAAGDIRHLR